MQRQCFYCKQTFQSSDFNHHLKHCPERQKRPNPPQYRYPPPQQASQCNWNRYQNNEEVKLQFRRNHSFRPYTPPQAPIPHPVFHRIGPQEPDDASAELIKRMLAAEKCILCDKNQGFPLNCGHHLCITCGKKYILNGITTLKWQKHPLSCPSPEGCDCIIQLSMVKECHLSTMCANKLEEMQNKYTIDSLIGSDPTITSCPKCNQTYSTEVGDIYAVHSNEKGPNGNRLSYAHRQHKARYRFRCSGDGCRTVFCSGCDSVPYHIGYTCREYKRYRESAKCRFCEVQLDATNTVAPDCTLNAGLDAVCTAAECVDKRRWSCDLVHKCGHNCIGLMGHDCIPCLNKKCLSKQAAAELTDGEFCNICFVDPLRAAPCVQLQCGHYFHFMCLRQKILGKWPSARITFGFLNCPLCKQEIHHSALDDVTKPYYDLKREIQRDAMERIKLEGLEKDDPRLMDPNHALERLAFYLCSQCKNPYFGGMKACEEAEQAGGYKHEELVCGSCASGPNAKSCKIHGKKYIQYKCKFCCAVSLWYCWGSTHFCDACHKKQEKGDYLNRKPISALPKCPGKDKCPLGVAHPANGAAEFSLGCVVCLKK